MKCCLAGLLVLLVLASGCIGSEEKPKVTTTIADVTTTTTTEAATATTEAATTSTTLIPVRATGPFQITAFYNVTTGEAVLQVEGELDKQYAVVVDYDIYPTLPLPEMEPDFQGERTHLARLQASQPSRMSSKTTPGPAEIITKDSRAQICITTNLTTFNGGSTSFSTSQDCRFIAYQYIPVA